MQVFLRPATYRGYIVGTSQNMPQKHSPPLSLSQKLLDPEDTPILSGNMGKTLIFWTKRAGALHAGLLTASHISWLHCLDLTKNAPEAQPVTQPRAVTSY